MSIVNQYRREIAIALSEGRQAIATLMQMIRDHADEKDILTILDTIAKSLDTFETEANLINENAEETTHALVRLRKQRDAAYRARDNVWRLLRRYQEQHPTSPKPKAVKPKDNSADQRAKKDKIPKQQRLF